MNKMINKTKTMIMAQLIFIAGVVIFMYGFAPRLSYPTGSVVLDNENINFRFKNVDVILIDDNPDFTSPFKISLVNSGANVTLEPGTYYWKGIGFLESSVKSFTINTKVGLEINKEKLILKNIGNVPLNVSIENESGSGELVILDVKVEYPINKSGIYKGEQYGE